MMDDAPDPRIQAATDKLRDMLIESHKKVEQ
jgi:hypothetical protein